MRGVLIGGYFCLSGVQFGNTMFFWTDNKCERRLNLPKSANALACMTTSLLSGVFWPISLPVMIRLENKWKKETEIVNYLKSKI